MTTTYQAIFRGGYPVMTEYTPGSDVAAGDIIVLNGHPFVAHKDIAANVMGELAVGGGFYDLKKNGSAGPVIAMGEEVAWIDGSDLATDVITSNTHFGVCIKAAATGDTTVRAYHMPNGGVTNPGTS